MSRKILVHDYSGHPFQIELSRSLAKRGYSVLHIYSKSFQTPKGLVIKKPKDPSKLRIEGIGLRANVNKYSFVKRKFQEKEYAGILVKRVKEFNPDITISSNTPLDVQVALLKACKKIKSKFIFWLQDLYGVAIKDILRKKLSIIGSIIGHHYLRLEKCLLRKSDNVVLITKGFMPLMKKWGVKAKVIPNWATISDIPVKSKANKWSKKNKLDKFCFMYAGTLGLKHNPSLLLRLALHFKSYKDVKVVVISEGLGAEWLKKNKKDLKLDNLVIKNYQKYEEMPDVLGTADVLVGILNKESSAYSVPSKVLTYLCAKRPLLLSVPKKNLAAQVVLDAKAGIVVEPGDVPGFLDAAEKLFSGAKLRAKLGENARKYASKSFDIGSITNRFEKIIKSL